MSLKVPNLKNVHNFLQRRQQQRNDRKQHTTNPVRRVRRLLSSALLLDVRRLRECTLNHTHTKGAGYRTLVRFVRRAFF